MLRFLICLGFSCLLTSQPLLEQTAFAQTSPAFAEIIVDDADAEYVGDWMKSTHTKPYYGEGYRHDGNNSKGEKFCRFTLKVPKAGTYQLAVGYTPGNRAKNVPMKLTVGDQVIEYTVNQSVRPALGNGFHPLGEVKFEANSTAIFEISNSGTTSHVIVDAVALLTPEQFAKEQMLAKTRLMKKPAPPKTADKKPAPPKRPDFVKVNPGDTFAKLDSAQLDEMIAAEAGAVGDDELLNDELFLRRVTQDLLGRQPTVDERHAFLQDGDPDKRRAVIDELLSSPEYGRNWADYWCDTISYRQMEPQLTFHNYQPFKAWLAEEFNQGKGWDETVFEMLTAYGTVGKEPETTFIAFHQGNPNRLAGETTRVFLGVKIACAECHDHPFIDMPQEVFHGFAAFFVRTDVKIPQLDSNLISIASKASGEQRIPGKKGSMQPIAFENQELELGVADLERRAKLAQWMVGPENNLFAQSYTNRLWARLLGRGFVDPVDDMGDHAIVMLEDVHDAVTNHFVTSGYDHRELFRLILNTRAYQQKINESEKQPFGVARTKKLRGDEVYTSLVTAIGLENHVPEREKKTAAVRFPPPPKTTRDVFNDAFGYDPSFTDSLRPRTMKQAMVMMNHEHLQKQINAKPGSGTMLAKLLETETDNTKVIQQLYQRVLARAPSAAELEILNQHLQSVPDRGAAFEDILWSLLNSAEFTTRH